MVTVTGVFTSLIEVLGLIVPVGIQPVYFWLTALITFGIVFMLVQQIPTFERNRGVAFVIALVTAYFVAASAVATLVISKLFPSVGIVVMFLLGFLMIIALLSPNSFKKGTTATRLITLIAMLFIIFMTYSAIAPELQATGVISESMGTSLSATDVAILIVVIAVIGVIYMIVSPPKSDGGESTFKKAFKSMFSKEW